MRIATKIIIYDQKDEKCFGEGPFRLLCGVKETGSLRLAAQNMGMSYTKALRLVKNAEEGLGFSLLVRTAGGKSGGGSSLTPEGQDFLERYQAYRAACIKENRRLFDEYFGAYPLSPAGLCRDGFRLGETVRWEQADGGF